MLLPGPFYFFLFYRTGRGSRLHIGLSAVAAQEQERHDKAHRLGKNGRVPDRLAAERGGKRQQHRALQHKAAADGNADGWDGALKRRQKAADDDVEAKEQIRNAVMPERARRVRDQLLPRVREVEAHELRRKDVKPEEEHRRGDANGRERIAQELSARGAVSPSVLEAHERLRALRDADHQLDDERRHIGDDRVGHNAVRTNIFEHRAVEEEDHQSRAQLRHAVGKSDGQDARVKVRIEAEFAQPERALFAEKVRKVREASDKL